MPRLQPALWIVTLLIMTTLCRADTTREVVARGKKATALVEIEGGRGYGTAFCIDAAGFFVTSQHILSTPEGDNHLTLILNPGEKDQKKRPARVLRQDRNADLALLAIEPTPGLTTLPLGNGYNLIETQAVIAFGYPFGKDPALGANEYPAIMVSTGHITALRKSRGVLQEIQLDASLNPGNSGGPVVDVNGQVLGIVMAETAGSGVNFAIPIQRLHAFLTRIDLNLAPTTLLQEKLHEAQTFTIQVATFGKSGVGLTVELVLANGKEQHRTFTARAMDGHTFTVNAVPVPKSNPPAEKDDPLPYFLGYHLIARQQGSVVGEQSGSLRIEGAPFPFDLAKQTAELKAATIAQIPWVRVDAGSGPLSVSYDNGCEILLPANASGRESFLTGYQTKEQLRGDFDIQFSYHLLEWPDLNGARFGLEVLNPAGERLATVHRVSLRPSDHPGELRESDTMTISRSPGIQTEYATRIATQSLTGKLRLTRTGGQFRGYRWNDMTSQWQEIVAGGNYNDNVKLNLIAWSSDGEYSHQQVRILIYGFSVNQGNWTLP
ncbi:MAG TPA: serine protease [Chthonomonadaceae bacterium]|nr:serine protease [Chthonomonadaceae bacterium]